MINTDKYKSINTEITNSNRPVLEHVTIKQIDPFDLIPHPENDYELNDIASLAESIKVDGQLNPIEITKENVIISGHRRCEALKLLNDGTKAKVIFKEFKTKNDEKLYLLRANAYREKTTEDKKFEARELHRIYTELKNDPTKPEYNNININKLVAEDLGVSKKTVERRIKEESKVVVSKEKSGELLRTQIELSKYLDSEVTINNLERGFIKIKFADREHLEQIIKIIGYESKD